MVPARIAAASSGMVFSVTSNAGGCHAGAAPSRHSHTAAAPANDAYRVWTDMAASIYLSRAGDVPAVPCGWSAPLAPALVDRAASAPGDGAGAVPLPQLRLARLAARGGPDGPGAARDSQGADRGRA